MGIFDRVRAEWAPGDAPLEPDPTWETLPNVFAIETEEGPGVNSGLFPAGTATIQLRNGNAVLDRIFHPDERYRGKQVRIVELEDGDDIFRGRIDKIDYNYHDAPSAAVATLHLVSGLGNIRDATFDPDTVVFGLEVDGFANVDTIPNVVAGILDFVLPGWSLELGAVFTQQLVKAPDALDSTQGLLELLQRILETDGSALAASHGAGPTFALRGRWSAFDLLDPDAVPAVTLVGHGPPYTFSDPREVPFLKESLVWQDPDAGYANRALARSSYLSKAAFIADGGETLKVDFSRTELPTIRQGWVEANARHWLAVKSAPNLGPAAVSVIVATAAGWPTDHAIPPRTAPLGLTRHDITFDLDILGDPVSYRSVVVGIKHSIDHRRWIATYGYESLDRYALAYPYDPLRLVVIDGDADHGIDSGAIWAP